MKWLAVFAVLFVGAGGPRGGSASTITDAALTQENLADGSAVLVLAQASAGPSRLADFGLSLTDTLRSSLGLEANPASTLSDPR